VKPLLAAAALLALAACRREPPLPTFGQVPAFQLTAQTGQPFERASLDGKVWVVDFFFTTCTGPCPRMSAQMRQVQNATASLPDVRLVSFTVDPARDTAPVLAGYARRFRAQDGRWFFLTGETATLHRLARDTFKLNSVDGSLVHSTRFVLVDRKGQIRGYYTSSDDDFLPRLLRDVRRVEEEVSS
jgi:protein SCO1/2